MNTRPLIPMDREGLIEFFASARFASSLSVLMVSTSLFAHVLLDPSDAVTGFWRRARLADLTLQDLLDPA